MGPLWAARALETRMPEREDAIWLTPEGHKALTKELEHLSSVRRHELAERLRESREHGEFGEDNSELDELKFEQAVIEQRIEYLKEVLSNSAVLSAADVPTRTVGIGSRVSLLDTRGRKKIDVILVSDAEAERGPEFVSDDSPLGVAILGRKKGEKFTFDAPAGKVTYEILRIGKSVK
ncbi:MAG: Transcription elongation factor GreA [Fimbriimonadales bacterium]|nr:Transcription elongation factor GreA [Fimbriimonadales bacterium]